MVDQYIFSGSLPENASTYVTRDADSELYDGLRSQKFCYVLNSRQSGKSSLRVQTMRRLRENGVECAAIDLSAGGIQNVPPEQWYADLIDSLIDIFDLDVDFGDWWQENRLNSLVTRFRKFLEEILLVQIKENIVIFIDEIDSVLSLNFPTDDFFAFIRSCYNQRVDNPEYNRLTFCLLGVASPSNLIQDKQRTPFNIGKAISLKGFQFDEVEPLEKGLRVKFSDSQAVIKEILNWTGGQPFLTQKLCQFMVEETQKENPRTVEQVVRSRIIENWESQDEPEHLRTIRARIFRNEERTGYLLELYKQVWCSEEQSEITADNTIEQSELLLSGLVERREGKLRIYNPIYKEVFNENWVENELKNLRPYSENFKFWVASGCKDESRLLRGKALVDAEEWAKDKNLSYQDKQFLAASREKEIQEKISVEQKAAQLERERKDKEAVEKRNRVLSEANRKAKQRIRNGTIFLAVTLLGAVISINWAGKDIKERLEISTLISQLSYLNGEVDQKYKSPAATQTMEQIVLASKIVLATKITNHDLRRAMLKIYISQKLQGDGKLNEAENKINESLNILETVNNNSHQVLQIKFLYHKSKGDLLAQKEEQNQAIESYKSALKIINNYPEQTNPFTKNKQLITAKDIESVYRGFINLLTIAGYKSLKSQVKEFLKKHYLDELNNLLANKKWEEADRKTYELMLYIANREEEGSLRIEDIEKFSCLDLKKIDLLWVDNSNERFGFSVQQQIWKDTGNQLGITNIWKDKGNQVLPTKVIDMEKFWHFLSRIGWYDSNKKVQLSRTKVIEVVNKNYKVAPNGILPTKHPVVVTPTKIFFSRCDL